MKSDPRGEWCIHYCKKTDMTNWNVMKTYRNDGVIVAAKTYDDVFKFFRYHDAWDFAKDLISNTETRYEITIKKVCRARDDAFYLAGN